MSDYKPVSFNPRAHAEEASKGDPAFRKANELSALAELQRKDLATAVRSISPEKHFVWDGEDEDDRPATDEELRAGIEAARRGRS